MKKTLSLVLSLVLGCGLLSPAAILPSYAAEPETEEVLISGTYEFENTYTAADLDTLLQDEVFQADLAEKLSPDEDEVASFSNEERMTYAIRKKLVAMQKDPQEDSIVHIPVSYSGSFAELDASDPADIGLIRSIINVDVILEDVLNDMGAYLYTSIGKIEYSYPVMETLCYDDTHTVEFDPAASQYDVSEITIDLLPQAPAITSEDITVDVNGVYHDNNGNIFVPWEKIEEASALTLDALKELCGDSLILIMDTDGEHVLFVAGHFSDIPATSEESVLESILLMKDLIGLPDNAVMKLTHTSVDSTGNTYYEFSRDVDGFLSIPQIIIIGADSNGQVTCITAPPSGVYDEEVPAILSFDEAEEFFISILEDPELSDPGCETQIEYYEPLRSYVYTRIVRQENGRYVKIIVPANYPYSYLQYEYYSTLDDAQDPTVGNFAYLFDPEIPLKSLPFTDSYGNTVQLPVSYVPGSGYYLLDKERNMIGILNEGSNFDMDLDAEPVPFYFEKPSDLDPLFVTAFHNMQNTFDAYSSLGLYKNEKPILVHMLPDDETRNAMATFRNDTIHIMFYHCDLAASVDVAAHELTHAIEAIMGGYLPYQNATGALDESYADIMGNLMEMYLYEEGLLSGAYVDTENWYIGESTGNPLRNMSDPAECIQPSKVYDPFYVITNPQAGLYEDYAGVHTNSGILANIAYRMHKEIGLTYKDLLTIFFNTEPLENPHLDYRLVGAYIEYSMQALGYEQAMISKVHQLFENSAVYQYDPNETWETISPNEGVYKLVFHLTDIDSCPEDLVASLRIPGHTTHPDFDLSRDVNYDLGALISVSDGPLEPEYIILFVLDNENADYLADNILLAEPLYTDTKDTEYSINYRDLLSSLYARQKALEDESPYLVPLVEAAQDMIEILFTVTAESSDQNLIVRNRNADNDDLDVYLICPFSSKESGDGYRLLLRTDAIYDILLGDDGDSLSLTDWSVQEHIGDNGNYAIKLNASEPETDESDEAAQHAPLLIDAPETEEITTEEIVSEGTPTPETEPADEAPAEAPAEPAPVDPVPAEPAPVVIEIPVEEAPAA